MPKRPPTPASHSASLPPLQTRLPAFVGAASAPAQALAGLFLVFVGSGSVGMNLALHSARLSPAAMTIIDPKSFKAESILTHPIQSPLRGPKARHTARLCQQISPTTDVRWCAKPVQTVPLDLLADADAVFMATDNLQAEVETGQLCRHLGLPLIHVAVFGPTLSANVRFFSNQDDRQPCPACGFGPAEWGQLNAETTFSCEGASVRDSAPRPGAVPTRSLSFLCCVAASLGMTQFLRHRAALGSRVADTNLEYCGYTHRGFAAPLTLNPNCPCDHTPFIRSAVPRPISELTLRDLLVHAGIVPAEAPDAVSISLDSSLRWLESGVCHCAEPRPIRRFGPPAAARACCPKCRHPVRPQPFFTHATAPLSLVRPLLDRPLRALGASRARWAIVRDGDRAVFLRHLH